MSRIYVLDTNIVSYFLKGTFGVADKIKQALLNGDSMVINPITYYEIKRGLLSSGSRNKMQKFEAFCAATGSKDLPFEAFVVSADIHADLRRQGIVIEDADIFIAAFCIVNEYELVTHNSKHFKNIKNLQYTDWL